MVSAWCSKIPFCFSLSLALSTRIFSISLLENEVSCKKEERNVFHGSSRLWHFFGPCSRQPPCVSFSISLERRLNEQLARTIHGTETPSRPLHLVSFVFLWFLIVHEIMSSFAVPRLTSGLGLVCSWFSLAYSFFILWHLLEQQNIHARKCSKIWRRRSDPWSLE